VRRRKIDSERLGLGGVNRQAQDLAASVGVDGDAIITATETIRRASIAWCSG
jgi:hypothetical protein